MTSAGDTTISALPTGGRRVRILLVEDHADTAALMARLLDRHGFGVRVAGNVVDALRIAGDEPFDVVVSDIGLPDGDGYELMRRIRDHQTLPGIAVTGHATPEDVLRSEAAGFVAHVSKPIDMTELVAVISRVSMVAN